MNTWSLQYYCSSLSKTYLLQKLHLYYLNISQPPGITGNCICIIFVVKYCNCHERFKLIKNFHHFYFDLFYNCHLFKKLFTLSCLIPMSIAITMTRNITVNYFSPLSSLLLPSYEFVPSFYLCQNDKVEQEKLDKHSFEILVQSKVRQRQAGTSRGLRQPPVRFDKVIEKVVE